MQQNIVTKSSCFLACACLWSSGKGLQDAPTMIVPPCSPTRKPPEEYRQLYEATRRRAQHPKIERYRWAPGPPCKRHASALRSIRRRRNAGVAEQADATDLGAILSARRETGDVELLKFGETFNMAIPSQARSRDTDREGVETRRAAPTSQTRDTVKG